MRRASRAFLLSAVLTGAAAAPAMAQTNVERQVDQMNRSLGDMQREQGYSRQQQMDNNSLRMQIDRNATTPPPFPQNNVGPSRR